MHQEIKATVIWLLLAFFLTFAGFWQAKVVVAQDSHPQHRQLPPPAKTKFATRPPPEVFAGDVVADYIARCEKGMTDQEIGWILEDFRNAGLDQNITATTPSEILFKLRGDQHQWYLNALKDGFRLSAEQVSQAAKKLGDNLAVSTARYSEEAAAAAAYLAEPEVKKMYDSDYDPAEIEREQLIMPGSWLQDGALSGEKFWGDTLMPWNLCTLSHQQEKITWHEWFKLANQDWDGDQRPALKSQPGSPSFMLTEPLINRTDYFVPSVPYGANYIFPLIRSQKIESHIDVRDPDFQPDNPGILLASLRALHPAQFKALLLMHSFYADRIRAALETESR
jgi:hypothetical protein